MTIVSRLNQASLSPAPLLAGAAGGFLVSLVSLGVGAVIVAVLAAVVIGAPRRRAVFVPLLIGFAFGMALYVLLGLAWQLVDDPSSGSASSDG